MAAITFTAVVDESRKLVIDLPADVPLGPVELTITPRETAAPALNPVREAAVPDCWLPGFGSPRSCAGGMIGLSPEALLEVDGCPPARGLRRSS